MLKFENLFRLREKKPSITCKSSFTHSSSGIAVLSWEVQSKAKDLRLQVAIDDRSANFPVESSKGWIGIHTHLLPNGPHVIDLRLIDGNGALTAETTTSFNVQNVGSLAEKVRKSLTRTSVPLFFTQCDSFYYDYSDPTVVAWFDRPDALEQIEHRLAKKTITAKEAEHLRNFVKNGYIHIPELIEHNLLETVNSDIDKVIEEGYQGYEYGSSQRIEGLHEFYPSIRRLWLHDGVMRYLRLLFETIPRPCQTLTFVFGSQQDAHQDTIHLTPFPAGYMCGVWIALEDVRPESGELEIFVGSHRLPRLRLKDAGIEKVRGNWEAFNATIGQEWKRIIKEGNFEKITYRPTKGSVLIWHENLMHGGSVRRDKSLSRRSIVSHVFADGAIAYYDSTGNAGYMEPVESLGGREVSANGSAQPDEAMAMLLNREAALRKAELELQLVKSQLQQIQSSTSWQVANGLARALSYVPLARSVGRRLLSSRKPQGDGS